MYKIQIEIQFRAGHRLIAPYEGKCNNMHGEGYTAIIEFQKEELDKNGMVFDFGNIKGMIKEWINEHWDHAYLCNSNDKIGELLEKEEMRTYVFLNENPTAENMARCLYDIIKTQIEVSVSKVGIVESFKDSIAYYES